MSDRISGPKSSGPKSSGPQSSGPQSPAAPRPAVGPAAAELRKSPLAASAEPRESFEKVEQGRLERLLGDTGHRVEAARLAAVEVSGVVSKYIGETEKNLAETFSSVETSGATLFFDEAEALFGRRTGVADSHDRYAT